MTEKTLVLVVDDDEGMVETLKDILELNSYSVDVAGNGFAALEALEKKKYDLALFDIKMPGMNGVDLFKKAKKISPETIVIMMTAYALEDLVNEALKEGAYKILYKPLDIDYLLETIKITKDGSLILIVDDNENTLTTLKDLLEGKGYSIAVANSGAEAIEIVKNNNVELILLDMIMPVMNGLETYLKIKGINDKITTIIITGYFNDAEDLISEALSNSVFSVLQKPLDIEKIVKMINELKKQNK